MFLIQGKIWPQRDNPGVLLCWKSGDVNSGQVSDPAAVTV